MAESSDQARLSFASVDWLRNLRLGAYGLFAAILLPLCVDLFSPLTEQGLQGTSLSWLAWGWGYVGLLTAAVWLTRPDPDAQARPWLRLAAIINAGGQVAMVLAAWLSGQLGLGWAAGLPGWWDSTLALLHAAALLAIMWAVRPLARRVPDRQLALEAPAAGIAYALFTLILVALTMSLAPSQARSSGWVMVIQSLQVIALIWLMVIAGRCVLNLRSVVRQAEGKTLWPVHGASMDDKIPSTPALGYFADLRWLRRLALGTDLLRWAMVLALALQTQSLIRWSELEPQMSAAWLYTLMFLAGALIFAAGMLITSPEPGLSIRRRTWFNARLMTCVFGGLTVALVVLAVAEHASREEDGVSLLTIITIVSAVLTLVSAQAYFANLAYHVPDTRLARVFNVLAVAALACFVVMGVSLLLGQIDRLPVPIPPVLISGSFTVSLAVALLWLIGAAVALGRFSRAVRAPMARR